MQVVIGGVGNVLHGDDGVGPYLVRLLEAQYEFTPEVSVADLGTPGLNLLANLWGADVLILVDAVNDGKEPGTVSLYRREDLRRKSAAMRLDPHSPALVECLDVIETLSNNLRVFVIGITGKEFGASVEMSDAVRKAVPSALHEILLQLQRLEISYQEKAHPSAPAIWWQTPPA